jgi:hypothetical protein
MSGRVGFKLLQYMRVNLPYFAISLKHWQDGILINHAHKIQRVLKIINGYKVPTRISCSGLLLCRLVYLGHGRLSLLFRTEIFWQVCSIVQIAKNTCHQSAAKIWRNSFAFPQMIQFESPCVKNVGFVAVFLRNIFVRWMVHSIVKFHQHETRRKVKTTFQVKRNEQ